MDNLNNFQQQNQPGSDDRSGGFNDEDYDKNLEEGAAGAVRDLPPDLVDGELVSEISAFLSAEQQQGKINKLEKAEKIVAILALITGKHDIAGKAIAKHHKSSGASPEAAAAKAAKDLDSYSQPEEVAPRVSPPKSDYDIDQAEEPDEFIDDPEQAAADLAQAKHADQQNQEAPGSEDPETSSQPTDGQTPKKQDTKPNSEEAQPDQAEQTETEQGEEPEGEDEEPEPASADRSPDEGGEDEEEPEQLSPEQQAQKEQELQAAQGQGSPEAGQEDSENKGASKQKPTVDSQGEQEDSANDLKEDQQKNKKQREPTAQEKEAAQAVATSAEEGIAVAAPEGVVLAGVLILVFSLFPIFNFIIAGLCLSLLNSQNPQIKALLKARPYYRAILWGLIAIILLEYFVIVLYFAADDISTFDKAKILEKIT